MLRNYSFIFTPVFSQFNLLNMFSSVAVNSLGEMVSPCVTPALIQILSLSLCVCIGIDLSVYIKLLANSYLTNPINQVDRCKEMRILKSGFIFKQNNITCPLVKHLTIITRDSPYKKHQNNKPFYA